MVNNKKRGFTLIEIIIVITIIVLFTGLSIASYNNYTEEQKLDTDAKKIVDILELARKKANTGDASLCSRPNSLPSNDIVRITDFTFSTTSLTVYQISPNCIVETGISNPTVLSYSTKSYNTFTSVITNKIKFSSGNIITFDPNTMNNYCLILKNTIMNSCRYIKVTNVGVISNGKSSDCLSCS